MDTFERPKRRVSELYYLGIEVPGRANVREPLNPPTMRLVRGSRAGTIVKVTLNEAQLTAIIKDAAKALDQLRWSREARVAEGARNA